MSHPELAAAMARAFTRRQALLADPELEAHRLFHGWTEGQPGLEIDRYGDTAVVAFRAHQEELLPVATAALAELPVIERVIARPRRGEPFPLRGELPAGPTIVREYGLRFAVELSRPGNPGLYLDARPARAWIREHAAGRRALNLFAFTGSLGVAAIAGGATGVTHVDSQRGMLERCRANHALNDQAIDDRDLARMNIYQHLRKNAAKRRRYGAIILDPPPVGDYKSDRTPGGRGVPALAPLCAQMLEPGGWLLILFHHSDRSREEHERELLDAAGIELEVAWRGDSGDDFPEPNPRRRLRPTAFVRPA